MSPRRKKGNTQQNGSPALDKKQQSFTGNEAAQTSLAGTTNYEEIHKDEAEALRSIYAEDFEEVESRPSAWHQSSNIAFKLNLKASSNHEVRVTLRVELPATYPKTVPNLGVEGLDDLRRDAKARIQSLIKDKPKTLLGSEMVYELAVDIQEILEDAAVARAEDKVIPSLEEERMVQEAAAREEAEKAKENELKKQEEASAEAQKALEVMVQDKLKQRQREKENRRKSRSVADGYGSLSSEQPEDSANTISFDPPLSTTDRDGRSLFFRSVHGKTLLDAGPHKETFTVRPAVMGEGAQAPILVLKEIFVNDKDTRVADLRQLIRSSEDKLDTLSRLRHDNLVEFIGFKIYRPPSADESNDGSWNIYTLFEHANKGSLSELLDIVGSLSVQCTKGWIIQLLGALEYYHRSGVVHGNIQCRRILLFRAPSGNTVVKLLAAVEESLPVPLSAQSSLTTSESPFWLPPELTQRGSQPTIKADVWNLAIVFLQMAFGKDILQRYTSANALMNALVLSPPLEEMLHELFRADPKKRPTAFQIQAFEFFRVDVPLVSESDQSSSMSIPRRPRVESQGVLPAFSRYGNDFDEVSRLGKGGYGQVVKARNKLDGRFYAVKKITQKSPAALKDTLSEIMLLSRLNHPYVVRYFTAWLEEDYGVVDEEAISSEEDDIGESLDDDDDDDDNVEFGYSASGLDFISSKSYPKIEFGYDSDDAEPAGETDTPSGENGTQGLSTSSVPGGSEQENAARGEQKRAGSAQSNGLSRTRSGSQSQMSTTLYIQMEYCEKQTLRDLIRNGLPQKNDLSWRLFRQILDGIKHIHGHGIIHRDLKPDNIFIDVTNNPRIGDFGLATSGQLSFVARSSAAADIGESFTRSIGTTYYVAPEMKSVSQAQYSQKVDMYSLGVIFFEMCHPIGTGMERDHTLQAIRQKSHELPDTFLDPDKAVQGQIIESLISHRPSERPTAEELLKSGKIPLQVEEETFRKAVMGLLSDPNSADYKKLLSAIFSQPAQKFEDITWDLDTREPPLTANTLLLQTIIKDKLTGIFRKHGAVETSRQSLFPRSELYPTGTARLLDPRGNLVQLPYDLIVPNARAISRQEYALEKTFTFGTVYRENPHDGEPPSHKEVDFDIVSYNTLDLSLKEAEVIKVLDEILNEFPPLKSAQMCFYINHSDLLDTILSFCRISPEQRPLVKEVISKLNFGPWTMQKIRSELRSPSIRVPSTSIDDLARFDFRDNPEKALKRLSSIMEGTEYADGLAPIFARMNAVISYLKEFQVKRKVYVCPLSSLNDKFFRGSILFQCVFDSKRKDVFAAGGRYDSLIQGFRGPRVDASRSRPHAVGFHLPIDRLKAAMTNYLKGSNKGYLRKEAESGANWTSRKCDVLVASFDPTVLRTIGVNVVSELWASDISAELAMNTSSLEDLLSKYKDDNHGWIVIVKQDSTERGFKVKNLARKEDVEVRSSELVAWIKTEIRHRNQRENIVEPAKISKHPSQQESGSLTRNRDPDVRVLVAHHKSRKTNRRYIIDSALVRSREVIDKALDGPIVAVDTRDEILENLRETRLTDPDSWRTLIQGAPLTERKYLGVLHELLQELSNENGEDGHEKYSNAFVYNYHTGSCVYYDLKRAV